MSRADQHAVLDYVRELSDEELQIETARLHDRYEKVQIRPDYLNDMATAWKLWGFIPGNKTVFWRDEKAEHHPGGVILPRPSLVNLTFLMNGEGEGIYIRGPIVMLNRFLVRAFLESHAISEEG